MVINCESCNAELEVPDSLADGQPVRCPYCHCRFIYAPRGCEETSGGEDAGQSSAEQTPVDGSAELWAFVFRLGRHVLSSWVSAWKSMFDFGGRMPRRDYLEFVVFQFFMVEVVCFLLGKCGIFFLEHNLDFFFYSTFFVDWIMLFPLVSAAFRRFHDANRSGRLLLLFSPFLLRADSMPVGLAYWSYKVVWGFSWHDLLWIAFFVVIGMQRTRSIDNAYLPLQSIRWPLVAFACMMLIPASKVIERMRSTEEAEKQIAVEKEKAARQIAEYLRNIPYTTLAWTMIDNGVYIVNTDGPADAQIMLVYSMGRLVDCNVMNAADCDAASRAVKIIRERYKLEGVLRSIGR